ncbi:phage tail protein [Saccharibacillus sp. CPCC 101409]|uniref:phage tail protein n=1 Tax=Saccharibacillus sp. CPCC 101409 TaxID=3058041 RepID=UPI0026721FF7|nr:phage tail protein [Saccharibacillus sp. CPCC 101409]MDO3408558.1 phage tail protein [Saccharibacillus sp. CPCC 101409]
MSSETKNLKLFKTDSEVDKDKMFNIDTMLNENWDKVDGAIGQIRTDLENIDPTLPDASTTQKGIVQLDDTTNGTSKSKAATADAVRQVRELADTKMDAARPSNLLPNSSGLLGLAGWRTSDIGWSGSKSAGDGTAEFAYSAAAGGIYRILESNPIVVFSNTVYNASVAFYLEQAQPNDASYIEVIRVDTGAILGSVGARSGDNWTRRGFDFTVPASVTSIRFRLVIAVNATASYKGFRQAQLTIYGGMKVWNDDSDIYAHVTDSAAHIHWGGNSTGDGTNNTGASYIVSAPLAPVSGDLPEGFTISFIPNVVNGGGDPLLRVNNCTTYALRRNATTQFAFQALKSGTVYTFVKVGNYFLARSAPPVGNATAAQVLQGVKFSSEAVPDGGTGGLTLVKGALTHSSVRKESGAYLPFSVLPAGLSRFIIFTANNTINFYATASSTRYNAIYIKNGNSYFDIGLDLSGYIQVSFFEIDLMSLSAKLGYTISPSASAIANYDLRNLDLSKTLEFGFHNFFGSNGDIGDTRNFNAKMVYS